MFKVFGRKGRDKKDKGRKAREKWEAQHGQERQGTGNGNSKGWLGSIWVGLEGRYRGTSRWSGTRRLRQTGYKEATWRRAGGDGGAGTNDSNSDDDNSNSNGNSNTTLRYGKEQGAHAEVRGEKWAAAPHLVSAGASWTAREQLTTALPFPLHHLHARLAGHRYFGQGPSGQQGPT